MDVSSSLGLGSAGFVEALYEDFLVDPASVPNAWRCEFETWAAGKPPATHAAVQQQFRELARRPRTDSMTPGASGAVTADNLHKQNAVQQLINEYRQRGHLAADTDPIKLQPPTPVPSLAPGFHGLTDADLALSFSPGNFPLSAGAPLRELVTALQATYCGAIGYIDAGGLMDVNVAIRTLVVGAGRVHCWGGGGLVAGTRARRGRWPRRWRGGPSIRRFWQNRITTW